MDAVILNQFIDKEKRKADRKAELQAITQACKKRKAELNALKPPTYYSLNKDKVKAYNKKKRLELIETRERNIRLSKKTE